jgi:uncharacterized membrane protein
VPQAPVDTIETFPEDEEFDAGTFEPSPRRSSAPIALDAGEVISTSWTIFKSQLGIVVAAVLIVIVLGAVANYLPAILGLLVQIGLQNNRGAQGGIQPAQVVQFAFMPLIWVFQIFLSTGQTILFLKVARGQPAEVGDLFRGGHYFLRALGGNLLFTLMIVFGLLLLVVPGVILSLMFWPFMYVLVDTDAPGMQCLSRAMEITRNTWGTVLLLWLVAFGLGILGVLACCVGTVFTVPLTLLLFAVAYCRMTGQPTARL